MSNIKIISKFPKNVKFTKETMDALKEYDAKKTDPTPERYFFDRDDSSHWYMIPEKLRSEWIRLMKIAEKEDVSLLPEWDQFESLRLGGGINYITFENPIEN